MSAFDLAASMDGLAALCVTAAIAPNVYAYPREDVTVPAVIVGYPTAIDFDTVFARGGDRAEIPVWHVVAKTGTKDARDALSAALADASSVKSALDGSQSFGAVRVTDAEISEVTIAGVVYLSVKYTVEIFS